MHWYKLLLFCSSLLYGVVASNDIWLRDSNGFSKDDYSVLNHVTSLKPLNSTNTYNRNGKRQDNTCDYTSDWAKMVCNYIPGPNWFYAADSLYIVSNAGWWIGDAINGFSHAIQTGKAFKAIIMPGRGAENPLGRRYSNAESDLSQRKYHLTRPIEELLMDVESFTQTGKSMTGHGRYVYDYSPSDQSFHTYRVSS